MQLIKARNPHTALPEAIYRLIKDGLSTKSRYGNVLVIPTPVTISYECPSERVLFWEERDGNPFLHIFTSLWVLAGRNDVAFLTKFVKRFIEFSDDGRHLHDAYGYRWKKHFGIDQLTEAVSILGKDKSDRRVVLTMWDPTVDLGRPGKAFPCNTHIYLNAWRGYLDLTVCCRSNDAIWGALGENCVVFTIVQEVVAALIGIPIGQHHQIANNFHAYETTLASVKHLADDARHASKCPYETGEVIPYPLVKEASVWLFELDQFLSGQLEQPTVNPFFDEVAMPLWRAHEAYKQKDNPDRFEQAQQYVSLCQAQDWRKACSEWIQRRKLSSLAKQKTA